MMKRISIIVTALVLLCSGTVAGATFMYFDVPCIGNCPYGHSHIKICNESTLVSDLSTCLVVQSDVKAYADAITAAYLDGFTATGPIAAPTLVASGVVSGNTVQIGDTAISVTAARINSVVGNTLVENITASSIEINELDGQTATTADFTKLAQITTTAIEINQIVHNEAQGGVMSVDFTGSCSDAEVIEITYGVTVYTLEFDTGGGPNCTGSQDVCMDVSGGAAAAQCGVAFVAAINGASVESDLDAVLLTDIVHLVGETVVNYTATETGAQISLSNAASSGDMAGTKHRLYHFPRTVTANEQTQMGATTGTMALGRTETSPDYINCIVVDSSGQSVRLPNTGFSFIQVNSGPYLIYLDRDVGGRDVGDTDVIDCFALAHE